MTENNSHGSRTTLAAFVLLGVFALMSVMTVLLCTQMYRRTVDNVSINGERRVLESYLADAVRSCDRQDGVRVEEIDGLTVLCLKSVDGTYAWTRCIYCVDGVLSEQITDDSIGFDSAFGEAIANIKAFDASIIDNGIVEMCVTDLRGETQLVHVALNCFGGEVL